MDESFRELDQRIPPAKLLGYLNFSDGRPDPRWQRLLHDAIIYFVERGHPKPWESLRQWLALGLEGLRASGGSAFQNVDQAVSVIASFGEALPAYRRHHADLLAHQTEADLFQPFFLVRTMETILAARAALGLAPPVEDVLARLNDFVGHRPIAILETRPRGEPYDHERHRPVPIYLRGVGVARGRYHEVLTKALEILQQTDPDLLHAAHLDLDLMDEFALDMRAYDHGHPVNRRPNYVFGEWDPHVIDNKGRYRRYVARQITIDGLLSRIDHGGERDRSELLFEAAAVLAGTILMAAGISGSGPTVHDSSATLAVLMPPIARYRDQFYQQLIERVPEPHAGRLRQDRDLTRQPFGGPRQHLNACLARHRALQMQQRYLSLLFAEMGYPEASRAEAKRIPTPAIRFLSDLLSRIATGHHLAEHGKLAEAAELLPQLEDLLQRGIACGALADPWNILGFQCLFPLSPAQEDSLRDPRLEELVQVVDQICHLYARLSSDAAAVGEETLVERLNTGLHRFGAWWDRFATTDVGEVHKISGEEAATSADHVAAVLGRWHERGEATADLAYWRQYLDTFHSPKSFALVIDALLRKSDYRAAMALLINWVGQANEVSLEEGPYSFHQMAVRWLFGATGVAEPEKRDAPLVQKFFDYLEANAEHLWQVPTIEPLAAAEDDERETLFEAAYEGMTYQDSTDNKDGALAGTEGPEPFDLEAEGPALEACLRFQATLARLWGIVARAIAAERWSNSTPGSSSLTQLDTRLWRDSAREHLGRLLPLLDALHAYPLPAPSGELESMIEYDRNRVFKEQLIYTAIATCLEMTITVGALTGASGAEDSSIDWLPGWGPHAICLEQAMFKGDADAARKALADFLQEFREEPLLFTTLADGGKPREILRVRVAQAILRVLLINLPRLGLLRETFDLVRNARAMEQAHPPAGRGVTEFNQNFQAGFTEAVEAIVESSEGWGADFDDAKLVALLERLTAPCLSVWVEHSRTVQISTLEAISDDAEWTALRTFIQRYGGELFHTRFLTLANLRSVLYRGVEAFLDRLQEENDPLHPSRLAADLDRSIPRIAAVRRMEIVLRVIAENYEEYKDYNATTSQSDYGENLHVLLEFLRLRVMYDRHAWEYRPLVMVHEVLARKGRRSAALLWERSLTRLTGDLARQYLDRLTELERSCGVRLNTIADRLNERFIKPLALDRLRALVEPALKESKKGGPTPSFSRLQEELRAYTATPIGVGLDVPVWLRLLEAEVHRVLASRSLLATLVEGFLRIDRIPISLDALKQQLDEWERTR